MAGIEPYDPNFTPTRINLSANENTYPVPAGVRRRSMRPWLPRRSTAIPIPCPTTCAMSLLPGMAWTRENICVGNGGDELLYNYLLAFGGAGPDPCSTARRAFSEYAFFASLCQTEVRDVWRDPATFELDQRLCSRRRRSATWRS